MYFFLQDDVLVSDGELKSSAIGSSLNYEYAKENNAGTYRCVFKNSGESVYRTMFVTVNKDVNEGIIAGIVIVIAIVVILIAILGRKIYKDKVYPSIWNSIWIMLLYENLKTF